MFSMFCTDTTFGSEIRAMSRGVSRPSVPAMSEQHGTGRMVFRMHPRKIPAPMAEQESIKEILSWFY